MSPTPTRSIAPPRPPPAALGKIDILVTSAGITGPNHPTWEYPVAAWDRVIDINLKGVFYCCHAVVPFMQANGYGRIVNIASIAGKEGNPERLGLLRVQGRGDRADQVAGQGTCGDARSGSTASRRRR